MGKRPLRILHIVGGMVRGGAETMIMNYYRHVDRSQVQFDFLTMMPGEHDYDSEIGALGGRIFPVAPPRPTCPFRHLKDLVNTMRKNGPFLAVHAHTMHHSGLVMLAAKMAGIKVRVCHSHNTSDPGTDLLWRKAYFSLMKTLIRLCANRMLACGREAGRYLFGERLLDSGKVIILPNALDLNPYQSLDTDKGAILRQKLGISRHTLVLGHVGRFAPQKNHAFFIPLMKAMKSFNVDVRLVLVGDGQLRKQVEAEAVANGLDKHIMFLGVRSDIPQLMSVFDVFILPSLYEGLPVTLIEAQAAGTPCVVSSSVTSEVDMGLNLVKFLDLTRSIEDWCKAILEQSRQQRPAKELIMTRLRERGYDVHTNIKKLLELYGAV